MVELVQSRRERQVREGGTDGLYASLMAFIPVE
jgi:hypothetical protein